MNWVSYGCGAADRILTISFIFAIDCVVAILDSADLDVVTVLLVAIVIVVIVEPVVVLIGVVTLVNNFDSALRTLLLCVSLQL